MKIMNLDCPSTLAQASATLLRRWVLAGVAGGGLLGLTSLQAASCIYRIALGRLDSPPREAL